MDLKADNIVSVTEISKVDNERSFEHVLVGDRYVPAAPEEQIANGMSIFVDGTLKVEGPVGVVYFVPPDPGNRHYRAALEWEAMEGNERTYVPLPGGPLDV